MRLWESLSLPGKKESVKNKEGHCAGVENKNLNTKRDKDILWDHKTTAAILCNSYYFLYVILLMVNRKPLNLTPAIKNKEAQRILC